jgi:hypothetical protein
MLSKFVQNKRDKLDPGKARTALDVQRQLAAEAAQARDGAGGAATADAEADAAPAAADAPGSGKPGLRLNLTGVQRNTAHPACWTATLLAAGRLAFRLHEKTLLGPRDNVRPSGPQLCCVFCTQTWRRERSCSSGWRPRSRRCGWHGTRRSARSRRRPPSASAPPTATWRRRRVSYCVLCCVLLLCRMCKYTLIARHSMVERRAGKVAAHIAVESNVICC